MRRPQDDRIYVHRNAMEGLGQSPRPSLVLWVGKWSRRWAKRRGTPDEAEYAGNIPDGMLVRKTPHENFAECSTSDR